MTQRYEQFGQQPGRPQPTTQKQPQTWKWIVGSAVAILIAWLINTCSVPATTPMAPVAVPPSPTTTAAPAEEDCTNTSTTWTANGTCMQGGEIVAVRSVIDADTIELVDGRTVRLLAIDAPVLADCAGPGAAHVTRQRLTGQKIKLIQEPGTDTDEHGNLVRYVAYPDSYSTAAGRPPRYAEDLGLELVTAGWAKPRSGGQNPDYLSRITAAADLASYQSAGLYAPPCGKPKIYGDDNGNGTPDYAERDERADADVYVPNPDPDPEPAPAPRNRERTGRSGHPCLPGERDGDGDGYCGEGR
jgi:endonuclease YncB( thermonuclease family)